MDASPRFGSRAQLCDDRGAVMFEAAWSLGVFLFLLIGGMHLLVVSIKATAIEFSTQRVARFAGLGNYSGVHGQRILLEDLENETGIFLSGCRVTIRQKTTDNPRCIEAIDDAVPINAGEWFLMSVSHTFSAFFGIIPISVSSSAFALAEPDLVNQAVLPGTVGVLQRVPFRAVATPTPASPP